MSTCPKSKEDPPGHVFLIEVPNGPTSVGRCKLCHEVRDFENAIRHKDEKGNKGQAARRVFVGFRPE